MSYLLSEEEKLIINTATPIDLDCGVADAIEKRENAYAKAQAKKIISLLHKQMSYERIAELLGVSIYEFLEEIEDGT